MAVNAYENFKGVTNWRDDGYSDNLSYGLRAWIRWALLRTGGFENVLMSQASGLYGGHPAILRPVVDPNFDNGQVWEGIRSDWVWETGVYYTVEPRACSGVYVDGSFKDTDTEVGTYAHYIDYPRGRVVFDSAIDTDSNVRCDYSFRIPTVDYSKTKEMQEILYGSLNVHRDDFYHAGSGSHSRLAQTRRTLPTIGIELVERRGYSPFQIGGGQVVYQDVMFYVLATYQDERDKLLNLLGNQNNKVIWIPNIKLMKENAQFPVDIDIYGKPVSNPVQYPTLIAATGDGGFRWAKVALTNASIQSTQQINNWLYRGAVRMTCEAIFQNI